MAAPPGSEAPRRDFGWALTNADGQILVVDAGFRLFAGAELDQRLFGRMLSEFVPPDIHDALLEAQRAAAEHRHWRGPLQLGVGESRESLIADVQPGGDESGGLVLWLLMERTAATEIDRLRVQVAALESVAEVTDSAAACRVLLQEIRHVLLYDWGVVLRIEGDEAHVVAAYPSGMAGADVDTRWAPLDAAERALVTSGTPSLADDLQVVAGDRSPLSRLPSFGVHSALRVPLFRNGEVRGVVALYAYRPNAFDAQDGIMLERYARPLAARLGEPPPSGARGDTARPGARGGERSGARQPSAAGEPSERSRMRLVPSQTAEADEAEPERLATLGALVSGVAHELNNPLTTILGYAHRLPSLQGEDQREAASTIEQEAERAGRIVRDLLYFAREQRPRIETVDLAALLQRIVDQRRHTLATHDIRLEARLALLPPVAGDEYQLEQVFLNLIHNAQLALHPDGGTITVTAEDAGDRVRVSVVDTGAGIPDEVRPRVLEPFVTTREVGQGAGLGLSIAYGIVTEHGGRLLVDQAPSGGARLVVELPVASGAPREPRDQAEPPATTAPVAQADTAAPPRVLIVDDEAPIRSLVTEILQNSGYSVVAAASAEQALAVLEGDGVDLVVTDLRMPGTSGEELFARVRERWPQLARRTVLMSGDVEAVAAASSELDPPTLPKPFSAAQLLETVRSALERS